MILCNIYRMYEDRRNIVYCFSCFNTFFTVLCVCATVFVDLPICVIPKGCVDVTHRKNASKVNVVFL